MAGTGTGTPVTGVSTPTVSVDLWFPDVVPAAQLCPNPIIRREIVNACRDLCERTMIWTGELDPIDVVENEPEYQLATTGADIVGADRAQFNGKTIFPTSETALDEDDSLGDEQYTWRDKTTDIPERYFVTFDKKIRLVYTPDADLSSGLKVWAILSPEITAITVPGFLWENFKEMIADGARGRLKSIPDMPWTDLNVAAGFLTAYESQMMYAKQKKHTGFQRVKTRAIVRTRYHDF
jgi:hypothetical protein